MTTTEKILLLISQECEAQIAGWMQATGAEVRVLANRAEVRTEARSAGAAVLLLDAQRTDDPHEPLDMGNLIAELKGGAVTQKVRIIVITDGDIPERTEWLDDGADDVIAPPEEPGELLARVRSQLRAARQLADLAQKTRIAEEGQQIAHTAFQALAVTEKMTRDAFSLDRMLKIGAATVLVGATVMAIIFFAFSRTATRETRRAYAAIMRLERGVASQDELLERARKLREELAQSADHQKQIEDQTAQLRAKMGAAANGEVAELRKQLAANTAHLNSIDSERKAAQEIIGKYSSSIGLLHVSVAFRDRDSGMRIRYGGINPQGQPIQDSEGNPILTLEGRGPEVRAEFFGTAFLAGADGVALTNRHVVQPWWKNNDLASLTEQGLEPVLAEITAYFPDGARGYSAQVMKISPEVDLATVRIEIDAAESAKRAVLSLDSRTSAAVSGQPVVLMGYATGLDAILARADEETVRSIVAANRGRPRDVIAELGRRKLIRPITTQGHIGDVSVDKIVYDAQTTSGGSGGPVFNRHGRVIGVNFAVIQGFGGSNFGIPIRYAEALMKP